MRDQHGRRRSGLEDEAPAEKPERNAAQRLEIRAPVRRAAHDDLRRKVGWRAGDDVRMGPHSRGCIPRCVARRSPHESEIENLHHIMFPSTPTQVDICRFDVAMDDATDMGLGQ